VFWATQPFRPDAVAAAKLALLSSVLLVLAGISMVVCTKSNVAVETAARLVATRLFAILGLGLVAIHLVTLTSAHGNAAELTKRALFALVLIGLPISIVNREPAVLQSVVNAIPLSVTALAYIGSAALFVRAYQQRERSWMTSGAVLGSSLLIIAGMFRNAAETHGAARGTIGTATVTLTSSFDRAGDLKLTITDANRDTGSVIVLADANLTVVFHNGERTSLPVSRSRLNGRTSTHTSRFIIAGAAAAPPTTGIRQSTTFIPTDVWSLPRDVSGSSVERVILSGVIETHVLREFARYPLRNGTQSRVDGTEIIVDTDLFSGDSSGPYVEVRKNQLPIAMQASVWQDKSLQSRRGVSFALTDSASRTLLPMMTENASYSGGPPNLLGFGNVGELWTLRPQRWSVTAPAVDSAWLANAFVVAAATRLKHSERFYAESVIR
jgi:hypothetical protein